MPSWYVEVEGNTKGPFPEADVIEAIQKGLSPKARVSEAGTDAWIDLAAHPEFAAALRQAAPPPPAPHAAKPAAFPLSPGVIWLLNLAATPLVGAILYYTWKKDHPRAAQYANKVSWLAWVIWLAVGLTYYFGFRSHSEHKAYVACAPDLALNTMACTITHQQGDEALNVTWDIILSCADGSTSLAHRTYYNLKPGSHITVQTPFEVFSKGATCVAESASVQNVRLAIP